MKKIVLLACFLLFPLCLFARASADLEFLDERYDKIDLLIAHGLVQNYTRGMRPWSEAQLQDMLNEAQERAKKLKELPSFIEVILQDLDQSLQNKKEKYKLLSQLELEIMALSDPGRTVSSIRTGSIRADLFPLAAYRNGRSYVQGETLHLKSAHWLQAHQNAFFYLQPRASAFLPEDSDPRARLNLEQGYAKISAFNTELALGRMQLGLGQMRFGGNLVSNNARPFDMVRLKNMRPLHIPYLGKWNLHFFLGTLGPEQAFPYTLLSGYKISWKPIPKLEFGYSPVIQFGGEGAPSFGFWTGVKEWLSLPVGTQTAQQYVNRLIQLDMNMRFASLRNAEVYAEATFDDKGFRHIASTLKYDAAYTLGLWFPRLSSNGNWQMRFEGKYLGPILYRHSLFSDGYTLNRKILGDALGSDSKAVYLHVYQWLKPRQRMHYFTAFEAYQDDIYGTRPSDGGRVKTVDNPGENRFRVGSAYMHEGKEKMKYTFEAAYELVDGFAFNPSKTQHNFMGAFRIGKTF